jgi:hypothetical protein
MCNPSLLYHLADFGTANGLGIPLNQTEPTQQEPTEPKKEDLEKD